MSMTMRMRELLPAPLGPRRPKISPRSTEKETASTASLVPNALVTPRTSSAGISLAELSEVLDDASDEPVLLGLLGREPEVAIRVPGDLLHRLAALLADDQIVAL